MRRFVDVKNDIAFRIIFGNEKRKETLISFLNAVLPLEDEQKIVSVEILRPFRLPFLRPVNATIMDVEAKDQNNNTCLVEIQLGDVNDLSKRVVYYASKSDSSQTEKSDSPEKLSPIFFIGILCFEASRNKKYINCRRFTDVLIEENREEDVEFIFIELPKFNKEPTKLINLTDQWVYFIKNAGDVKVIPENTNDPGLKNAYDAAEQYNWTQPQLDAYDSVSMREQVDRGIITCAYKEGQEARAKERRQREKEIEKMIREEEELTKELRRIEKENAAKILSIAKNCLKQGISIKDTAEATGLTVEEVKKLTNKK